MEIVCLLPEIEESPVRVHAGGQVHMQGMKFVNLGRIARWDRKMDKEIGNCLS